MEVGGVRLEGKEVAIVLAGLGLDDPNPNTYKGSLGFWTLLGPSAQFELCKAALSNVLLVLPSCTDAISWIRD